MARNFNLTSVLVEKTKASSNNIVKYLNQRTDQNIAPDSFFAIGNNAVLNFIVALIYLFSALEEVDWCVLSSNEEKHEFILDKSPWSINYLIKRLKYIKPDK